MKVRQIVFGFFGVLAGGCALSPVQPKLADAKDQSFSHAIEAARYRYEQRLGENGAVPPNALMEAKYRRDAILATPQITAGGAFPASWTWIGPGKIGGRMRAIIVHPTQTNTIWIGSAGGGIWKTTDGGATWFALDDFMASLSIGCMAIDPSNPNTLYAGTGEGFFDAPMGSSNTAAIRGAGIFKTLDGGDTWEQLPSTASWNFVNRIAVHPTNPNILWTVTDAGIFKSTDGGSTWAQKFAGDFLDLKLNPSDPLKLVANRSHVGVYFSADGGETWTQATGISGDRVELAYAPSNTNYVYAARSLSDAIKIYRSIDGGQTFTQRSGSSISTYSHYNSTIWVDPTNQELIVYGGVSLYRSADGGNSRTNTFTSVHADMHAVVNDPGFNGGANRRLYVGCDGGIYRIDDAYGSSASRLNNNISLTQFYGAAVHDAANIVVAGAQDNGTNRYTGNPLFWNENVIGGDGTFASSDPTDSNYWYAGYQLMSLSRSSDKGLSFPMAVAPPGAGSSNNFNFAPYFTLDPNNPNRMLACGEVLWRSNNIKTGNPPTWTSIKPSIRPPSPDPGDQPGAHFAGNNPWNISWVTIAEGNSDVIWVGHNDGHLYKTSNGTAVTPTWTRVDETSPFLPNRWISSIVIDPTNVNHVYVSFMGWASNNVWETSDAGATWRPINGSGTFSLPPAPVSAIAVHRTKPGWLYAGTDIGIFTSSDNGASWTTKTDGPGTVPIDELVWRNDSTLMVVTHGRGIYFGAINTSEEPFVPASYSVSQGRWVRGRLQELFFKDDKYLVVLADPRVLVGKSRSVVQLDGVSPVPTSSTLQLEFEGHVDAVPATYTVEFFDFTANAWVAASSHTATLTDSAFVSVAPGPGGNYIEPGTRKVRTRITTVHNVSGPAQFAHIFLDQTSWKAKL